MTQIRKGHVCVMAVVALVGLSCASPQPAEPPPEAPPPQIPEPSPEPLPEDAEEPEEEPPAVDEPEPALGSYGVSAGDGHAVDVGMQILQMGGNAVDAAVATAFAVSVVEPFASGIGGGGAAVIALPGEDPVSIDYREVVANDGVIPASETGIPGFVSGMQHLLDHHGTLTFAEVLPPSIELAREGVPTSATLATQLTNAAHRLPVGQLGHFFPGGSPLEPGELLVQEDLAQTLDALAAEGAATFTDGAVGAALSANIDGIDEASLASYQVQASPPARGGFADHQILAASPPLPGAALVQMLQIAEAAGAQDQAVGSSDLIHTIAMAWRIADRSIATHLGDPDYVEVPVQQLTDADRNAELAASISADSLAAPPLVAPQVQAVDSTPIVDAPAPDPSALAEAGNTTHLTVVDDEGGMVSMTNTITNFFGSGLYSQGFFLNDQLRRFSIGGQNNAAEAGRRSVSWSLPAIVTDQQGRAVLGLGSPGGRRIPIMLAQVLVGWGLHGQSLEDVVTAPRFHLEGDELFVERFPTDDVVQQLRQRGYAGPTIPDPPLYFGSVQALAIDHDTGEVIGARDDRREADLATASVNNLAP